MPPPTVPIPAEAAGSLTPSQARALRQQERVTQQVQLAQGTPRGGIPRPPHRCATAEAAPPTPSVAQGAALQDVLLRHLVSSIDFAADSAPPQMAPIALADYNIVVERPHQPA